MTLAGWASIHRLVTELAPHSSSSLARISWRLCALARVSSASFRLKLVPYAFSRG